MNLISGKLWAINRPEAIKKTSCQSVCRLKKSPRCEYVVTELQRVEVACVACHPVSGAEIFTREEYTICQASIVADNKYRYNKHEHTDRNVRRTIAACIGSESELNRVMRGKER